MHGCSESTVPRGATATIQIACIGQRKEWKNTDN